MVWFSTEGKERAKYAKYEVEGGFQTGEVKYYGILFLNSLVNLIRLNLMLLRQVDV